MRALNGRHLGHDYVTDVLAFDLRDASGTASECGTVAEICVCLELAAEAARAYNTNVGFEVMLYIVHGMLHLVGERDDTEQARRRMRRAEKRIMADLRTKWTMQSFFRDV